MNTRQKSWEPSRAEPSRSFVATWLLHPEPRTSKSVKLRPQKSPIYVLSTWRSPIGHLALPFEEKLKKIRSQL